MRAVRAGKESYAVIGATLRAFARGKHEELIPIYRMLSTSIEELRARAMELTRGTTARIIDTRSLLGGGTTPTQTIASIGVAMPGNASQLHAKFLALETPVVGTIEDGVFRLDLRTVLTKDVPTLRQAIVSAVPP